MTFREICRKKIGGRVRGSEMTRKPARKPHGICRLAPAEVCVCPNPHVDIYIHIWCSYQGELLLTDVLVLFLSGNSKPKLPNSTFS